MDSRDREAIYGSDHESFDEKTMTLTYLLENEEGEEFDATFPAKYEVCELCNGKGKHVNPSIDAHGISGEEFAEDPDFAEEYMSGTYDVMCYRCKGSRVSPLINEDDLSPEQKENLKLLNDKLEAEAQCRAEDEYCRRYEY